MAQWILRMHPRGLWPSLVSQFQFPVPLASPMLSFMWGSSGSQSRENGKQWRRRLNILQCCTSKQTAIRHTPVYAYSHLQIDNRPSSCFYTQPPASFSAGQSPGQLIRLPAANHARHASCVAGAPHASRLIDKCVPASVFFYCPFFRLSPLFHFSFFVFVSLCALNPLAASTSVGATCGITRNRPNRSAKSKQCGMTEHHGMPRYEVDWASPQKGSDL